MVGFEAARTVALACELLKLKRFGLRHLRPLVGPGDLERPLPMQAPSVFSARQATIGKK